MPLEVTLVHSLDEITVSRAIRHEVFVIGQNVPVAHESDDKDFEPTTRHFLGRDTETGEYVATSRCIITPALRKAKVGRVAVLEKSRGKGHGLALLTQVEALLRREADTFVLSAQCDKTGFYEKCGYAVANEEVYMEGGMKHCMMIKTHEPTA